MMMRSLMIMLLVVAGLLHLSSSRPVEKKSKDFVASKDVGFPGGPQEEEDVDMMPFSISWSRIFPDGSGRVNQKGVDYYNRMIDFMIDQGMTPCVKLYNYYPPLALEKKYKGLLSRQFVNDFADYADFCFKTFGDRVKKWMTLDEPRKVAAPRYNDDPERRCSNAYGNCTTESMLGPEPLTVAHHLILAHAAAVQRYRQKYQETQKGRIGILLDFVNYVQPRTRSMAAVNYTARDTQLGWFLHPIVHGEYPRSLQESLLHRLPKFTAEEVKMVKGSSDFIGINQYTTSYYKYDPHQEQQQQPKDFSYQKSS